MFQVSYLWWQFFLQDAHFALHFLAALVFFAASWLYWDAWRKRPDGREVARIPGLFILGISYFLQASTLETGLVATGALQGAIPSWLPFALRILGYGLLLMTLLAEPLPQRPVFAGFVGTSSIGGIFLQIILVPVMSLLTGLLYLRRATWGLERHLKVVAYAFITFGLAEAVQGVMLYLRQSTQPDLYLLAAPFGTLWLIAEVLTLIATFLLGRWVWQYLLKRFQSQLLMIFMGTTVTLFIVTTVVFTGLLLHIIESEVFSRLQTDVKVLELSLNSERSSQLASASSLASQSAVIQALAANDAGLLQPLVEDHLVSVQADTMVITNQDGQIIARGEDSGRVGDSISDDPLIKRALTGEAVTSIVTKQGVVSPSVEIQAATPIKQGTTIIGAVLAGRMIDTPFVDAVKQATGLETAVYGQDKLAATTLTAVDGTSRDIGTTQTDPTVKQTVLERGQPYAGPLTLLQTPYFTSWLPLKDINNQPIGMLLVAQGQLSVFHAAGEAIQLTFIATIVLLLVLVLPAYLVARNLTYQIK